MAPLKWLLAFLLVAKTLASAFTTMSTKGRTETDAQNDAAPEYVNVRSLLFQVIFAPVNAVTLGASDLGRIVNGRDGYPDEKRPFLFSFSKPKPVVAWRKIEAMVLTRACLKHPNVWSVAGGQGLDAGKLEALAATHKKNQGALAEADFNNTFAGSVRTTRTQCGRQQTKKKSRRSSGSAPSTRKICGSSAGQLLLTPRSSQKHRRQS